MKDYGSAKFVPLTRKFLAVLALTVFSTILPGAPPLHGQGIPIRRASPVVTGQITVENTIIKAGAIPGILYGTNPGFRYFFTVKNRGSKPFSGKVEIALLHAGESVSRFDKSFEMNVQPGQQQFITIDSENGPALLSSHGTVTGFSFQAFALFAEGSGSLAADFDRL